MKKFTKDNYKGAITKSTVDEFNNESSNISTGVKKIQDLKENIVSKIFSVLHINKELLKKSEDSYFDEIGYIDSETGKLFADAIINMNEPQTRKTLKNNLGYIGDFTSFIYILNKYVGNTKKSLELSLNYDFVSQKDKNQIKKYLKIITDDNVENSKSKKLNIDEKVLKKALNKSTDKNNIECFYEYDFKGKRNYFSLNTLLNYIDTFGAEIGLPNVDTNSIDNDLLSKTFPSINRKIKVSMYKTILQNLRDKQEVLMYGFKDYQLINQQNHIVKNGYIAEKVVELEFRELSNLSDYNISIVRSSIGEDQQNKVDLFIILQDKKTGIKIKDELQITLKTDLVLKKEQVKNRNQILNTKGNISESKLVNFNLNNLREKLQAWKYFNRPIGKITDTLNHSEKALIRKTFLRLVGNLEKKKEQIK